MSIFVLCLQLKFICLSAETTRSSNLAVVKSINSELRVKAMRDVIYSSIIICSLNVLPSISGVCIGKVTAYLCSKWGLK